MVQWVRAGKRGEVKNIGKQDQFCLSSIDCQGILLQGYGCKRRLAGLTVLGVRIKKTKNVADKVLDDWIHLIGVSKLR